MKPFQVSVQRARDWRGLGFPSDAHTHPPPTSQEPGPGGRRGGGTRGGGRLTCRGRAGAVHTRWLHGDCRCLPLNGTPLCPEPRNGSADGQDMGGHSPNEQHNLPAVGAPSWGSPSA